MLIPRGEYPFPIAPNVVPGSDGAGTVVAVGKHVSRFQPGDKVVTVFSPDYIGGPVTSAATLGSLGAGFDGVFRTFGIFKAHGLVALPKGLTMAEGATLPCAGVTAWNALFGLSDNKLLSGQWVLTQGTGGVSVFALQFAKAIGARVIATTGSSEKVQFLKDLGADHVINYKDEWEWGSTAKKLTGGIGVDHVVETSGPPSMAQSLNAVKVGGVISIIGFVAGQAKEQPGFLECLLHFCTARGIMVGSRAQMEEMCQAIEANLGKLHPVVDTKTFKLDQLKEAFEYLGLGQHKGKVVLEIE